MNPVHTYLYLKYYSLNRSKTALKRDISPLFSYEFSADDPVITRLSINELWITVLLNGGEVTQVTQRTRNYSVIMVIREDIPQALCHVCGNKFVYFYFTANFLLVSDFAWAACSRHQIGPYYAHRFPHGEFYDSYLMNIDYQPQIKRCLHMADIQSEYRKSPGYV